MARDEPLLKKEEEDRGMKTSRRLPRLAPGVLVSALVLSMSMSSQGEVIERIVAKVNGEIITKTALDREVQSLIEQLGPAATPEEEQRRQTELRQRILDRMVDNLLVLQVATERGLRVPPRYFEEWSTNLMKESNIESEEELVRQLELQGMTLEGLRKQFEEGLLVQEIRRMEVDNKISVTEPEIEKYYRQHITDYTDPAKVRLREIVVRFEEGRENEAGDKARRLLQDIQQGADFAEMARRHSESSSKEAGGDLGFFEKGELTAALDDVAFALGPGEVSDLIRLEKAYYIIRVEEKIDEKTRSLDESRKEIADTLFQKKLDEQSQKYLKQLRERAIIEIKL
ncbi:MAG: peptidylprolyl isomerase [Acidobacteriota bacterium]